MKTTIRFENAIQKLYTAFYSNSLIPECCMQCAVGNIMDQKEAWKHLSDAHGSLQLNYVGKVHEMMGRRFNGYLPSELLKIEVAFLQGCGYQLPLHHAGRPENPRNRESLFNGLCEVVACLCDLDQIENVMDFPHLFQIEKDRSSLETSFV